MTTPAITVEGLTRRFGAVTAVDALSFTVPVGSVTGFLGPNGAGKTTTLNVLVGLGVADAGAASVLGVSVGRDALEAKRLVGYLPEEPLFPGWMSARDAVTFAARLAGISASVARTRADDVLERVGLAEAAHRRVSGFSRGMRQRLGLAQAIVHAPPVLLLDEPSSALDPAGRRDALALVAGLAGEHTVLLSTHILADVERVCERAVVIHRGRLLAEAPIAEIKGRLAAAEAEVAVTGDAGPVRAALEAQACVASVEAEQVGEHTRLRVRPADAEAARTALPQVLAPFGGQLERFEWLSPDLEEAFLRLVNGPGGEGRP
jgi:ABC-2 type transport system ATP-binding protein